MSANCLWQKMILWCTVSKILLHVSISLPWLFATTYWDSTLVVLRKNLCRNRLVGFAALIYLFHMSACKSYIFSIYHYHGNKSCESSIMLHTETDSHFQDLSKKKQPKTQLGIFKGLKWRGEYRVPVSGRRHLCTLVLCLLKASLWLFNSTALDCISTFNKQYSFLS